MPGASCMRNSWFGTVAILNRVDAACRTCLSRTRRPVLAHSKCFQESGGAEETERRMVLRVSLTKEAGCRL